MQKLAYSMMFAASPERVWDVMLTDATYRLWTAPFAEGSYFEGSWETGATIRFRSPEPGGMLAEVAESRRPEFLSIRHVGSITKDGVEDRDSEAVRKWAPAYETYRFEHHAEGTELRVELDAAEDWVSFMNEAWPKALAKLKQLVESE